MCLLSLSLYIITISHGSIRKLKLYGERNKAFKSGDTELHKTIKRDFEKAVKKTKGLYKHNLENKLMTRDTYGVWRTLGRITGYKRKAPVISEDITLPDELNAFYSRFSPMVQVGQLTLPSWPSSVTPIF